MLVYQALERFAYFGVGANLVNFMTTQLHQDLVSSIRSVNNWSGVGWIAPVLGAYIADSYIGRFWTITVSLVIYALVIDQAVHVFIKRFFHYPLNFTSFTNVSNII